jgi:uncharacterized protein YciI
MNTLRALALICVAWLAGCAQLAQTSSALSAIASPTNDWFIFLERGKPTPADKDAVALMQKGHIANFERLFAEKKLFAAGPLNDPSGLKRGIVVVNAPNLETLRTYFVPDQYVNDGYMTLNARRTVVHKSLNTIGIDPKTIEEVRIIQITRPSVVLDADTDKNDKAFLQALVDNQMVGAWYTLQDGPVAEVLFTRIRDNKKIEDIMSQHPSAESMGLSIFIWSQWLSKGVVS